MEKLSRRWMISRSSGSLAVPLLTSAAGDTKEGGQRKLKVVVVGAHVDDAQSGCGGTIALYAGLSHDVVALSLTRGDSESIAASRHMAPQEPGARRDADGERSRG